MKTSRRDFLASTGGVLAGAALTAAEVAPPPASGKTLRIGMIGVGGRGSSHLGELASLRDLAKVEITAVCDVWRPAREKAAVKVEKAWGRPPRVTSKVDELLALPEVDAVVIATPDFSHAQILARAVRAGKDAYCEKPMATNLADANTALEAVEKTGRIVEIGTQRRSDGHHIAAVEIVRSGVLGTVSRVNFEMNFHHPRWKRSQREMASVSGADVDWEEFNLGKKGVPFEASRFLEWQLDREFTSGIPGLWMSHFIDLVPWFLDDPFPRRVAALGGVYVWKDGRYTTDTFHALLEYPKGFLVSFAMALGNSAGGRFLIHGTNGTLDGEQWTISGDGGEGPGKIKESTKIQPKGGGSHLRDFLDCLRTRGKPHADIHAGYSHAVATVMAAEALRTGETKGFDPARREITEKKGTDYSIPN